VDSKELNRLLKLVDSCDAVLDEHSDSPDPVAERRVKRALAAKAQALEKLGHYDQSLTAWSELLGVLDDDAPAALVARVLIEQRAALQYLDRLPEAVVVDREIVDRFGRAEDQELRVCAADALNHQSWVLIKQEDPLDQLFAVSDELLLLFAREPDETVLDVATILANHAGRVLNIGAPTAAAVGRVALTVVFGAGIEAIRPVAAAASRHLPPRLAQLAANEQLSSAVRWLTPTAVRDGRRRLERGIVVCQALADRLADADDPELQRLRATVGVRSATAEITLGRVKTGFTAFEQLIRSGGAPAAQALDVLAEQQADVTGPVGWLGTLSFLSQRAEALGGEDKAIAQIAYDDSVADRLPSLSDSRLAAWMIRLFRPSGDGQSGPEVWWSKRPSWLP
jgi:hypothetical protein